MAHEAETSGRVLQSSQIGEYTLLNNEKLGRALDLIDGVTQPQDSDESRILAACKKLGEQGILALYDRMGGAIRHGERKLKIGTFFNFGERVPHETPQINEDDYEDEYVLTRKQIRKNANKETAAQRAKRLTGGATTPAKKTTKKTAKKTTKKTAKKTTKRTSKKTTD